MIIPSPAAVVFALWQAVCLLLIAAFIALNLAVVGLMVLTGKARRRIRRAP